AGQSRLLLFARIIKRQKPLQLEIRVDTGRRRAQLWNESQRIDRGSNRKDVQELAIDRRVKARRERRIGHAQPEVGDNTDDLAPGFLRVLTRGCNANATANWVT